MITLLLGNDRFYAWRVEAPCIGLFRVRQEQVLGTLWQAWSTSFVKIIEARVQSGLTYPSLMRFAQSFDRA